MSYTLSKITDIHLSSNAQDQHQHQRTARRMFEALSKVVATTTIIVSGVYASAATSDQKPEFSSVPTLKWLRKYQPSTKEATVTDKSQTQDGALGSEGNKGALTTGEEPTQTQEPLDVTRTGCYCSCKGEACECFSKRKEYTTGDDNYRCDFARCINDQNEKGHTGNRMDKTWLDSDQLCKKTVYCLCSCQGNSPEDLCECSNPPPHPKQDEEANTYLCMLEYPKCPWNTETGSMDSVAREFLIDSECGDVQE